MLKNIMKRTVCSFLALVMVVTSVCFFDLSGLFPTAEAASSSSTYTTPDVYISVPETFYLQPTPVWNDASKTALNGVNYTTVQYYINNTVSGAAITPDAVRDATSGKIFFSASSGTVTDLKYSILGTNISNVAMNSSSAAVSGVTLNAGMSATERRTLEWIFTCKIDGRPAEYHAYTVAYAPYYTPVGVVMENINDENNIQLQGLSWVSGVHSFSDTTNFSKHYPRNAYGTALQSGTNIPWHSPMVPMLEPVQAPIDNNQDSMDWITTVAGEGCAEQTFTEYYDHGKATSWTSWGKTQSEMCVTSQTGNLTVDISRNQNFNTIPNLTTGAIISDCSEGQFLWYGFYMANYNDTPPANGTTYTKDNRPNPCYSENAGEVFTGRTLASEPDGDHRANWDHQAAEKLYDGVWTGATPSTVGTSSKYIHMSTYGENNSNWIFLNGYLKVDVTAVNKEALRELVFEKQQQADAVTSGNYAALDALLKSAYTALGDPTASQATVDSAVLALFDASATADATKTTIVRHVDARTGKLMPGNNSIESITSDLYDTVTVTPNTYTGYTLTGQYRADKDSLFSLNRWNGTNSGAAINNNSVASKSYDALTDTLTLTVTASDTHTADYRGSNVFTSGYDYFAVDPQTTYLLNFEYAGTGNGDIGLHCYDENGAYLGAAWVHRVNHTGLMAATGSNGAFRSETFSFCPAFYDGFSSSLTTANALRMRYVSLCFGGYPNNAGNSSYGPAATAANPLTCIFRNVKWTPVHNVFDMNAWYASSSGEAGNNQTINSYDAATNTLSLTARANDTYTKASRDTAGDIRTSGYHFFEVNPYETYTVSYEYAGTGNGDIGVWCYDENGHYLGYAWYHKNNYAGMMAATGNDTSFQPGSFDFCPATYTRPSGNSTYITPDKGARTKYIALTFGGYPNPTAGTTPVTNVFRNVLVTAKAPNPDLFDSAAWAASSCAANGSGVSSVSYDAASDTITVVNSGTDTFTAKYENNILNSGYYYIPVDPDGTYTLDFDYASPTRAEVGVICYDANGNHIGNMWLFDSLKATGSTGTYRHHTEVICPQSNQYLFGNDDPARFDVHFIAITFGNYTESGQSAATCNYRNVAITETNELFDMAQWAFRSANRYRDGNADLPASDIAYDSETKTLTITAREEDTISAYAATNLLTEYETVGSSKYPFYYTPVEPGTTYTFEGEYAGTGNGDLGVIEYKADGTVNKKTWCHTNNNAHDILDATGSGDHFAYFTTSITTQANTKYIQLCFGGYPNSTAATTPVTCVFRDVKMHRSNAVTVPSEDSVFTFYYRPNMYTVAFDGNGSTAGSMADQKYIYNTAQELKQNAFQRVFHVTYDANHGDMPTPTASNLTATSTFAGWATTANGTSVYANRQTVNNLTSTDHATVTLYATWTPGSVTLPQVTRGGYTFAGWYTAASGGENVGTTTYAPTEDNVTLYARWSPNTFTLTFDENGVGTHENMPEDMELAFDTASDPLPGPQSPKIDGWTFLGWAAYDANGGIGDEEENGQLRSGGRRSAPRRATRNGDGDGDDSEAEEPTDLTTVTYYVGDTIPAQTVNEIIADVGDGGVYTLYAVWVKGLKTEFVDYNNGTQRTREYTEDVYNGKSSSLLTAGITQGEHTGWETAGWTMSREKGVLGSALESEIAINSNDNLFDMTAWWASSSHINGSNQAQTYLAGGETLTSVGAVRDVMSKYNNNNLITENFNCIAVDPYKTYTLGVEYAGSGNVSGQVGVHFYDADGNFLARCWMFTGHDSGYGDPHRGGDHFGDSTGLTDFHQENIEICPMTFESSYLGSFTEAQRASVAYIALSFGNYSDDNTISASNKTTVIYRNVTFTENRTYYGVYTQEVALTYDKNTTDTVTNMPSNPAPQDRIANSALGFGDGDVFNPTFTLSSNAVARTGYTYQGWNTDRSAATGQRGVDVEIDEDTVYYAIWTAHQYTIAFNENGVGTAANMPASITATYNAATGNLPAPTNTTVDGWTFRGWAVSTALTTVAHAAGEPIAAADVVSYYTADGATFTLYAVWEKTITAAFIHYPGGTRTTDQVVKVVYNGASASVAAGEIPTQGAYTGWTAEGWTTSQQKTATGSAVGALTLTADVTYYGVYTKQITLTYDPNTDDPTVAGMPQAPAAQQRRANSYLGFSSEDTVNPTFTVSSAEPTRTGYTFGGWANTASDTVGNVTGTLVLTDSKILYAVWALAEYHLTVSTTVGGSVAGQYISGGNLASISVASNSSATYTVKFNYTVSGLVPTPATGYTFTRWEAENLTLTGAQQTATSLSFNMPASDASLRAVFTPNPYTITYHHESLTKVQNCTYDQLVTLFTNGASETATQTAFSKTGYTFDCWVDGSDTRYTAGFAYQTAPNFTSVLNGNFDLYAAWTQNGYDITYELNGGSADASRPTHASFDDPAFSVSAPTKNGYTFSGWTVSGAGFDTTTAQWGTTGSNLTALANSTTKCVNGESGSVYFRNLASADNATVTLTATWTAKQYVLRYASGKDDNLEVVDDTYAYDDDVTVAAASILGTTYPGYSFIHWIIGFSEEGETRNPGSTFNLSTFDAAFDSLDVIESSPTVYMYAEWEAREYRIVYSTNGYAASAIQTGGRTNSHVWKAVDDSGVYLNRDDTSSAVRVYGAYSDLSFSYGADSYFYLNNGTEVRFGLGWAFSPNATTPDVEFLSDLYIDGADGIPDAALDSAAAVQGETNLYDVTLYMVWSANYKPYEDKVAQFQHTFMTYPASGNTTLRGGAYTGADAVNAVYTNAPQSAKLPAVSNADAAYKIGGSEANYIWNNDSTAADYALYNWVAGPIGNPAAWQSLPADNTNDFTSTSLAAVNGRIRGYLDMVIYDPCAQFAAGKIVSQADETEHSTLANAADTLDVAIRMYTGNKNNVANSPQSSALLAGLVLKDADLDKHLTSTEMLAISSTYGAACPDGENAGMGYRPDEARAEFLSEVFEQTLNEMYPDCEDDGEGGHHSFNSLIALADDIFATFGFDPTVARDNSIDYFMDGTLMGFALDGEGYVINPDCPYTTKSVYKLFDLIYGRPADGTYKSLATGSINLGNVALYYQVKDELGANADILLKKPSQLKVDTIVTTMAYGYHSLELEKADYTEFETLFAEYFDATWGETLRAAGYSSVSKSNYLSSFSTYFTEESYAQLSRFVSMYFSEPGVLKSTYEKLPAVEQNCVDGRPQESGFVRTFKNPYIDPAAVDLSGFNFAEGTDEEGHVTAFADRWTYDQQTDTWTLDENGTTLCSLYCDAIDALVPALADYTSVFQIIANSITRTVGGETLNMIDTSVYNVNTFYPSNAQNMAANYTTWRRDYAKSDAWGSTRTQADNKPAYDTVWLYRYYTKASVDALADVIGGINWNYNKLDQNAIDEMQNGAYKSGTVCKTLQDAINGLTPKTFVIEFYRDVDDQLAVLPYHMNTRKPYRYGENVAYSTDADPDNETNKTFVGWNTMPNALGHSVSSASNNRMTDFDLDATLLEDWWKPDDPTHNSATIETNGTTYTVMLYAEWVDNVTLDIVMSDNADDDAQVSVQVASREGSTTFTATHTAGCHPTYEYGSTLTFGLPSRTGYQFDAWVFRAGGNNTGSAFAFDNDANAYVYTFGYYTGEDKTNDTLTATWIKNTYTVTYNKNHADAAGTMAVQTFRYDTPQALLPNGFTRTGFRLVAWTTNADGTGDSYEPGATVNNLTTVQNGNVDLFAKWDYADFELTFVVGSDGEWSGWQGEPTHADTLTKKITYQELYAAADEDGKTWPNDPVGVVQVKGDLTIRSSFLGWFTDPTDTSLSPIDEAADVVRSTALQQTLYARFETQTATAAKNRIKAALETLNANDYTMDSMKAVDEVLVDLLTDKAEVTPEVLARLNTAMEGLEYVTAESGAAAGDTTPPVVSVYENKQVIEDAITSHAITADAEDVEYMRDEDTGEIHYVFPGKAYYTYYCYTNSAAPAIMVNAKDLAGASGRVSYPVTVSMDSTGTNSKNQIRTRSGLVGNGWMNYSQDTTDPESAAYNPRRSAGYHIGTNNVQNPYRNDLTYFGMDFDGTGYDHYMYEQYILLKPTFDTSYYGKQYALYTFEVKDDSYNGGAVDASGNDLGLAAGTSNLAGAENTNKAAADLTTTTNEDVTPTNTVTVFVEYYNTMNGHDGDAGGQVVDANGVGTANGNALEVYNGFRENGHKNNVWVNKDFLYRNAAGAANADFIPPITKQDDLYTDYLANDPVYGQNDVGSFYYLMEKDEAGTTLYWNAYYAYIENNPNDNDVYHNARVAGAHAALDAVKEKVVSDMKDAQVRSQIDSTFPQSPDIGCGDYVHWPYGAVNTQWSTMYYARATEEKEALVYVHIYDRWGNHYTNILQRDLQDTQEGVAAAMGRGQVTINELGGSGVQGVSITELNTDTPVAVSGMTDGQAWNVVNNQFTITGLPEGSDNYQYTMTVTDNAGNVHTENFRAASDGSVVVTVNDETMGGKYADAANKPLPNAQDAQPVNGVQIGSIDEPDLTTVAIEQVDPNEIKLDTIPDQQLNGGAAPQAEEERPDLYTFTLNEIYTVNLFADSARDYTLTLRSTAGGLVKAYVNGTFAPAKGGKVFVPSGSQVQIRISSRAGYELQSLTMQYADGRIVDLVGAYNAEINDDATIKAIFTETKAKLRISAENGSISGKEVLYVSPYSRVAAIANVAPEGKVFAYWVQDGDENVPVSYDEIYSFIATSDVNLKAVYADAPTEQVAGIVMDAASPTHVTVVNGMYTLSYSGKIHVPEGAQIEEFGMVLTNQSGESCTADNFVIGGTVNGTNVANLVGQTLTEEGQCKININNVKPGQTRTGRLYLTVKLADGTTQTLYSGTWSELTTPAA